MSAIPETPWCNVSIDFAGPLPTGEMLLVAIDDFSRFPEVEIVGSTAATAVIPKLDAIYSRYGIPETARTDNRPPFQGEDFSDFSKYLGFKHHRVTPLWPQANGTVERFMRTMMKTIRTANIEHRNWKQELNRFLRQYRATPHSTTSVPPAESMFGRRFRIQLPQLKSRDMPALCDVNKKVKEKDQQNKTHMKKYADEQRGAKASTLKIGDTVIKKQRRVNKLTPQFDPVPYRIISRKGNAVTAERGNRKVTRNVSFFKRVFEPQTPISQHSSYFHYDETLSDDMPMQAPVVNKQPRQPALTDGIRRSGRATTLPVRFKDYLGMPTT